MAYDDLVGVAGQLGNLYQNWQGLNTANNTNNTVQGAIGQNTSTTNAAIMDLQKQIAASRAAADQQYNAAKGDVTTQNSALGSQADSLAQQLQALSDPNSAYMQNARSAIERKDAAAGRRSQWGERETQLQGTLADYVGKYAPGLNNSITAARDQISKNNQGLASLYSNANSTTDRNMLALVQLLQQQLSGATAANTTGRQAANSATNNITGLLGSGTKLLGSLKDLFNGGGTSGINDLFNPSIANGVTGFDLGANANLSGSDLGSGYGSWGTGGGYFGNSFGGSTGGGLFSDSLW